MNAKTYTIERAYDMDRNGRDRQIGWDILVRYAGMSSTNWCNRYALLRDAKAAAKAGGVVATVCK
jgi:hypothetical protein